MPDPCTQKETESKSEALQYDHPVVGLLLTL